MENRIGRPTCFPTLIDDLEDPSRLMLMDKGDHTRRLPH